MSAALQMVLAVEGMFMSSLPPGQLVTSRVDCVSTCYRNHECLSVFYNTTGGHCNLVSDIYTEQDMEQEYSGMEYLVWAHERTDCHANYTVREDLDLCIRVSDVKIEWQTAENNCVQDGGHLILVKSDDVNTFVDQHCQDMQDNAGIWIGGTDSEEEGVWKWTDNSNFNYTAWNTWEPNPDPNGGTGQNCAGLLCNQDVQGKWADLDCDGTRRYICQTKLVRDGC